MNVLLCICSLVIIITSVDAAEVLSSEKVYVKDLSKRFVKLLEAEIQTCVTLVSTACKKEPMLKQLEVVQKTLSAFELELTPDCFTNSQEYTGKRNTTKSGHVCQKWNARAPHEHSYNNFPDGSVDKAGNYCRDPSNSGAPWCLTEDPKTRDEDCSVPRCDTL
ncbi:hypothetical protein ACJMK2_002362 [Sinanodonta woodiana]|uniref:Kringle domain-containing protein n=1 Tax=Sinanodonta woodiana TaxID=1069815 RepID=A0ABD3XYB6_SINWO